MFNELVGVVKALPRTVRDFLVATPRNRQRAVLAHVEASTISPAELEWLLSHNFACPSADLAHAAVRAGNVELFAVVIRTIKRGWDDVLPAVFQKATLADARAKLNRVSLQALCNDLEAHGVGAAKCSTVLSTSACKLLRSVRWRINKQRMSKVELTVAAKKKKMLSVEALQKRVLQNAQTTLDSMVAYTKQDNEHGPVNVAIVLQWVRSIALRRSIRPTHGRLFTDMARYSARGSHCTAIAHAACVAYANEYVGVAQPIMFAVPSVGSTAVSPWADFWLVRRARYVIAWSGPLQMAYFAIKHQRPEWFAAALCLLPPRVAEGQAGWREEANLAGTRIAAAVASTGIRAVSPFCTLAATLIVATGHGVKLLSRAGCASGKMAQNLCHVWGKPDAAAVLASYVASDALAESAVFELVRCQCTGSTRRLPDVFSKAIPAKVNSPSDEQLRAAGITLEHERKRLEKERISCQLLARRLRLPILRLHEQECCVALGVCLARRKRTLPTLPAELISEILKWIRRGTMPQIDTVALNMSATRLGDYVF